jgi:putative aminopeptidase FrvX
MYIDIGATSQEEVEAAGVRLGDPIVPKADFIPLATGKTYLSKAFDDRVGTALVVSALQSLQNEAHPNTVFGVATVMEEVGLRGATTSVRVVDPDVAIILESDIAGDVPGIKPEESSVKLGQGPTVLIYESRLIPNLRLRNFLLDTAKEIGIPVQISSIEGGSTDGAVIHLHSFGVPTAVIGVAARHIHTHSSILHRDDYDSAVKLLVSVVKKLDTNTVSSFTA